MIVRNLKVFEKTQYMRQVRQVWQRSIICVSKRRKDKWLPELSLSFSTQNFRRFLRRETFPAKGLLSKTRALGSLVAGKWQTSGPSPDALPKAPDYSHSCVNSSAQHSHKRPESERQEHFLFCLLLCFCSVTAWNLRPLGWWSLSSLSSLSLLILLVVQGVQRARILSLYSYLPFWPPASKQRLTISSCINKTSHSTAVLPDPSPVGGTGEFECLTIHHIASPGKMRNDWACPHCDWVIQIPLP